MIVWLRFRGGQRVPAKPFRNDPLIQSSEPPGEGRPQGASCCLRSHVSLSCFLFSSLAHLRPGVGGKGIAEALRKWENLPHLEEKTEVLAATRGRPECVI